TVQYSRADLTVAVAGMPEIVIRPEFPLSAVVIRMLSAPSASPAMKALKNIDVAFICMNLPYTMPPSEAAECAKAFQPKIVYPYHFRGSDPQEFASALKGMPAVEVRIRKWY